MGIRTEISWADSTVNPTTGCDGCELWVKGKGGMCYAGILHERRLAKSLPVLYAPSFTETRLAPGRMRKAAGWSDLTGTRRPDKPWLDRMPRSIFVGDMGDIFSKGIPFEYLKSEVIDVAAGTAGRRHIWMLLTKQPGRAVEFSRWLAEDRGTAWPPNVWSGVSVTSSNNESRADVLCYHRAAVKFLSVEPMLGPVSFANSVLLNYQLVIVGGESGHGARPCRVEWVRSIVRQCRAVGVACFVKQLGANIIDRNDAGFEAESWTVADGPDAGQPVERSAWPTPVGVEENLDGTRDGYQGAPVRVRLRDRKGGTMEEWPLDLRVRQWPGGVPCRQ